MERITSTVRADLPTIASQYGFDFYVDAEGKKYWDESAYYKFTLEQIERDIEDPTVELNGMMLDLIDEVVNSEQLLTKLAIPPMMWDEIRASWVNKSPSVYGRFDLRYDGKSPAKLYEANFDTPTSLFEASVFQWDWLEDMKNRRVLSQDFDQYNSIHEKLIRAWQSVYNHTRDSNLVVAGAWDESIEDAYTMMYMMDVATQAGFTCTRCLIEGIGVDDQGRYVDSDDFVITNLFKLHPWEEVFRGEYAGKYNLNAINPVEPLWKAILSNKAILPLLWERHRDHPNLLEARFMSSLDYLPDGWVKKPFFSREGAGIELAMNFKTLKTPQEEEAGGFILQKAMPLPAYDNNYPVIGSWVVGNEAAGIGIREDDTLITKNTSRFVPHVIVE